MEGLLKREMRSWLQGLLRGQLNLVFPAYTKMKTRFFLHLREMISLFLFLLKLEQEISYTF